MEAGFNGRVIRSSPCTESSSHMLPEAELWTAVILQGIKDLSSESSHDRDSARLWFNSACNGVHSFTWVCQLMEIEPNFIRSALEKRSVLRAFPRKITIRPVQASCPKTLL